MAGATQLPVDLQPNQARSVALIGQVMQQQRRQEISHLQSCDLPILKSCDSRTLVVMTQWLSHLAGCTRMAEGWIVFFLGWRVSNLFRLSKIRYDGASVNSRKKNSNFFSPPFFLQNSRKKKFSVFPKTAEKKINFFSPTFFQKQQKKKI